VPLPPRPCNNDRQHSRAWVAPSMCPVVLDLPGCGHVAGGSQPRTLSQPLLGALTYSPGFLLSFIRACAATSMSSAYGLISTAVGLRTLRTP